MQNHFLVIVCISSIWICDVVFSFNVEAGRGIEKFLLKQKYQPLPTEPVPRIPPSNLSFFGYAFQVSAVTLAGKSDVEIQFPVSAPLEMTIQPSKSLTHNDNEDDVLHNHPTGENKHAMGKLYTCEIMREHLVNKTFGSKFNCSYHDTINRDLLEDDQTDHEGLAMSMTSLSTGKNGDDLFKRSKYAVCAPARVRKCGYGTAKTAGICYVSKHEPTRGDSGFITNWYKKIPCRDRCAGLPVDLIFLIDGSKSVQTAGEDNFDLIKEWVVTVASSFDIAESTQVGVVQYSYWTPTNTRWIETEIPLGFHKNFSEFEQNVKNIEYHGYQTFTAHAINKTVKEDFMGPSGRYPDARRVLILVTDGAANDASELDSAVAYAESQEVERFAVGVGRINKDQLTLIASKKEYIFTVSDFDGLSDVISQLQNSIETLEGHGDVNDTNKLSQCEAGFSTDFSDNGRLLLGAVGAYDWSGTVAKYDSAADKEADIPDYAEVQKVLKDRTKESYLGYSVTTGKYNGGSQDFVASGAPRYYMRGAVVVYKPVANSKTFNDAVTINPHPSHEQFGSYFGGTLLSMDLNNDQKDDLLVAAPLYIGQESDEGRVFVYISKAGNNPEQWADPSYKPIELKGRGEHGARFGTAMASAGDLNKDGYNDVIIGAPLTEDGKGAIYVYHGSADGIISEPRQRIAASEVQDAKLQYFGQSLQGGVDLDGNTYPDVAVGAPRSDTIAIFRSRPVATFIPTINFQHDTVSVFDCLDTPDRLCQNLTACLTFTGENVEQEATVNIQIKLDPEFSRLQFRPNGPQNKNIEDVALTKDLRKCFEYPIYMKDKITNYNDKVTAVIEYELTTAHTDKPLSSISDP